MWFISFILFLCFAALALDENCNEYSKPLTAAAFAFFVLSLLLQGY